LDKGVYIAIFYLPTTQQITVGKLGRFGFQKGFYFYAGSAQRNLTRRFERHNKKVKPLHWHIDYVSARAKMIGAITVVGGRDCECKLAKGLKILFKPELPGFGASDCRCGSHLFYAPTIASFTL